MNVLEATKQKPIEDKRTTRALCQALIGERNFEMSSEGRKL